MLIKHKRKIIIAVVFALALLGAIWYCSTAWERAFEIKYVGFETGDGIFHKSDYYHYQITNTTNKTYTDLCATINVEADSSILTYIGFSYKGESKQIIRPGETIDYEIYVSDIDKYAKANDYGFSNFVSDVYISHISYN